MRHPVLTFESIKCRDNKIAEQAAELDRLRVEVERLREVIKSLPTCIGGIKEV
jgi:hypothetical protein